MRTSLSIHSIDESQGGFHVSHRCACWRLAESIWWCKEQSILPPRLWKISTHHHHRGLLAFCLASFCFLHLAGVQRYLSEENICHYKFKMIIRNHIPVYSLTSRQYVLRWEIRIQTNYFCSNTSISERNAFKHFFETIYIQWTCCSTRKSQKEHTPWQTICLPALGREANYFTAVLLCLSCDHVRHFSETLLYNWRKLYKK